MKRFSLIVLSILISVHFSFAQFTFQDINFWVGTGSKQAMLVIDFNDSVGSPCFAWGYRFDGITDGQQMMNAISAVDPGLNIVIGGGFLSDITYLSSHAGLGGAPDYWSTWSGTSTSTWTINNGVGEPVNDNDWFGCSYGWTPSATAPDVPIAAPYVTIVPEFSKTSLSVFPQPANDHFWVRIPQHTNKPVRIFNNLGMMIKQVDPQGKTMVKINRDEFESGIYYVYVDGFKAQSLIIQ